MWPDSSRAISVASFSGFSDFTFWQTSLRSQLPFFFFFLMWTSYVFPAVFLLLSLNNWSLLIPFSNFRFTSVFHRWFRRPVRTPVVEFQVKWESLPSKDRRVDPSPLSVGQAAPFLQVPRLTEGATPSWQKMACIKLLFFPDFRFLIWNWKMSQKQ